MQPFVANLRAHWPGAWITMVLDTPYVEAVADVEELDEILELPAGRLGPGRRASLWVRLLRAVGRARYDLALDFARNEQAQLLLLVGRARRRVTYERPGQGLRRRWPYTDVVGSTPDEVVTLHTVDLNNRLLAALDIPTPHRVPRIPVSREQRVAARSLLEGLLEGDATGGEGRGPGGPLVLVHPGSGAEARRWPPESFARAADHAVRRHGARVVVLGGPAEAGVAQQVVEAMVERARYLPAPSSVRVLIGLLAEADHLLCNDSGPMHIAAAVGTPVCALYGAQSRVTWAPLGDAGHRTFQPPLPCGEACVAPGTCVPDDPMHAYCIRRIPPGEVTGALDEQLARHPDLTGGPS